MVYSSMLRPVIDNIIGKVVALLGSYEFLKMSQPVDPYFH